MRVRFKKSIRQRLDEAISNYLIDDIEDFVLTKDEYIDLLEDLNTRERILISGNRCYKGIPIVLT